MYKRGLCIPANQKIHFVAKVNSQKHEMAIVITVVDIRTEGIKVAINRTERYGHGPVTLF